MSFDGVTFDKTLDGKRLGRQFLAVKSYMLSQQVWQTLNQIALATGYPEASISARLRDLRKERFGSYEVKRRRLTPGGGTWEYLVVKEESPKAILLIATTMLILISSSGIAFATNVQMRGIIGYEAEIESVRLHAEQVYNLDTTTSDFLKMELWIFESAFDGSEQSGFYLAEVPLGTLMPDYFFGDIDEVVPWLVDVDLLLEAIAGIELFPSMMLTEGCAPGDPSCDAIDWINFDPLVIPEPEDAIATFAALLAVVALVRFRQ